MSLSLQLFRNNDQFVFITDRNQRYKLKLLEARLMMRVVEASPSLTLAFERQLQQTPAKIPMRRTEIKVIHVPAASDNLPNRHIHIVKHLVFTHQDW
jgi:hypothetical protein